MIGNRFNVITRILLVPLTHPKPSVKISRELSSPGRLRELILEATSSSCDHVFEFPRWSLTRVSTVVFAKILPMWFMQEIKGISCSTFLLVVQ